MDIFRDLRKELPEADVETHFVLPTIPMRDLDEIVRELADFSDYDGPVIETNISVGLFPKVGFVHVIQLAHANEWTLDGVTLT